MPAKIVECVPNFSEGCDEKIVQAIADAMSNTPGCTVLDVDAGKSTNRTVYTFVGSPEAVVEGAFNACKVAKELIDMRKHHGEHPRMGACDVCPFIPVQGVTMDDCVEISKKFAKKAAEELGIPCYLYEYASNVAYRKTLPQIRAGEYEHLAEKIIQPEWKPDFGPAEFVPTWGATVTGARKFLVAYNVNVLGTKEQAHRLALNIRENGRGKDQPGKFKCCKAIGWYVDEYDMAQVSINLTDYEVTGMAEVYEELCKEAQELNISICGSQIVGLIPLASMMQVADYYIKKENLFILEQGQKLNLAINKLGLHACGHFDPKVHIIEYRVENKLEEPLASLSVRQFIEVLGSRTAAPGGGSTSALVAAMGSALGAMVGWMTYGSKKFESLDSIMRANIAPLHFIMKDMIPMIDEDTNAFNSYMSALKMPKDNEEQIIAREEAMQNGLKHAVHIPLSSMKKASEAWPFMIEMAKYGNIKSKSDLQVGVRCLEVGIWGCYQNVLINLKEIKDESFINTIKEEATLLDENAKKYCEEVLNLLNERDN
ncbi:hypothetical protein WA158_000820 [Blastocystis sp. Blastoise]